MLTSWVIFKKPEIGMSLNGALAGLVGITAGCANVSPTSAVIIGLIAGVLVVFSVLFFDRIHVDDPVGAISVHGVVGMWGLLAVCFTNPDARLGVQLIGLVTIFAWVFITSFIVWFLLKKIVGIRVSEQEEYEGVDISECGLEAYPEFTAGE